MPPAPDELGLRRAQQAAIPELHQVREESNQDFLGKDQVKTVLMGHISSQNVIFANDDFYRFNVDKIIRGGGDENSKDVEEGPPLANGASRRSRLSADLAREKLLRRRKTMLQKHHFRMNIQMAPTGDKIYKINFD